MTIFITDKNQAKRFCPWLNNFCPEKKMAVKCNDKNYKTPIGQKTSL